MLLKCGEMRVLQSMKRRRSDLYPWMMTRAAQVVVLGHEVRTPAHWPPLWMEHGVPRRHWAW